MTNDESFWENWKTDLIHRHLGYLDSNDPYTQADQLIEWIAGQSSPENAISIKSVIKAFYQVQYTFNWPLATIPQIVYPALQALNRIEEDSDENPYSFQFIQIGQQIDLKTMQPMNEGTMVKQPFGVVILKGEKIISKARVLCQ